jgi:hypothetical protein
MNLSNTGRPAGGTRADPHPWVKEFPGTLTVCDKNGIIIDMTDRAAKAFAEGGNPDLVGAPVYDCHPEAAKVKLKALMDGRRPNVYTFTKNGRKKFVFQAPWFIDGEYAGYLDLTLEIPEDMPHFDRDAK